MALNKAMYRLLEGAVEKNFTDTQLKLSQVSAVIKKNKTIEVIIPTVNDPMLEDHLGNYYSILPPDLYWTINARVETVNDPLNCSTAPSLPTMIYSEYVAVLRFPDANPNPPFYQNVQVTSSTLGTLYTAPSPIIAGFNSKSSGYTVINDIREFFYPHQQVKAYWERYRDKYYRNSFIFVSTVNMGIVSITGTNLTTSQTANTKNDYTISNRGEIANLTSKTVNIRPVKISEPNLLYSALKENQFYATRLTEISADQTLDYFITYGDPSFIITRLYLDYIRKPKVISLPLNQTCELSETTHSKIVDLAAEILRLDTKDQGYQQTVQDTQLRTN